MAHRSWGRPYPYPAARARAFGRGSDHRHASAALPHCRAFFTDRRLHLALTEKLRLQDYFDCMIESDPEAALQYLAKITD